MLCVKFNNDLTNELDILDERDFANKISQNVSLRKVFDVYSLLQQPPRNN